MDKIVSRYLELKKKTLPELRELSAREVRGERKKKPYLVFYILEREFGFSKVAKAMERWRKSEE